MGTMRELRSYRDVNKWMKKYASPEDDRTSLHIHCLDFDSMEFDQQTRVPDDNRQTRVPDDNLIEDLTNYLTILCLLTDGICVTSASGSHGSANILNKALTNIKHIRDLDIGRSIAVAIPESQSKESVADLTGFTHVLWTKESDVHSFLRSQLVGSGQTGKKKPTVFVMINGGSKLVKKVFSALDMNIPFVLLKGSGGFTDFVIEYLEAKQGSDKSCDRANELLLVFKKLTFNQQSTEEAETKLKLLYQRRNLFTVCNISEQDERKPLEAAILEALIKCDKPAEVEFFVRKMTDRYKQPHTVQQDSLLAVSFLSPSLCRQQLVLLMDSLSQYPPASAAAFIRNMDFGFKEPGSNDSAFNYLQWGMLKRLYSDNQRYRTQTTKKSCSWKTCFAQQGIVGLLLQEDVGSPTCCRNRQISPEVLE
ncbi:hypothetical protein V1264_024974 [Littorina saxatilis]|uniref:LSDAT prokaryote domain-containing protein n=1 Tax=Littorina saxatilis TaxID=31220 RepID=A0AAN9FYX1_9CAEN